jgi:hypothetical protein
MANRFDSALMSRERNRQELAEVLEESYAVERRKSKVIRLCIFGGVLALSVFGLKSGFTSPADFAAVAQTQQKLQDRKKIIEEIEKQMESGEQMMIGAQGSERTREIARSNGDADSYGNEKVPLNLVGEVRQKKRRQTSTGAGSSSLEFGANGGARGKERDHELEDLRGRRSRKSAMDYGKYRPATPAESTKNPLPARSQIQASSNGLYAQVPAPAPRLAADTGAYPDLQRK